MAERTDMKDFAARLEEEAEKKVEKIEAGDLNMIKKSFEASLVLADAFLQLKAFIAGYTFRDEAEEIEFFKDVPLTRLSEYVQRAFNIELDKNLSRTFGDLCIRNRQTPFLDSLKAALLRRMNRPMNSRPGGRNRKTL